MPNQLDVATWRTNYLYGIPDVDPSTGTPFPEANYEYHLNMGYMALEMALDIAILPVTVSDERHDYYAADYAEWGYLRLFKKPVRTVTQLRGNYPVATSILTIPNEWLSVDPTTGVLNVIPVAGTVAGFILQAGGALLPELFRFQSHVPRFWGVDYEAGFADGQIPDVINDAAAKLACMSVLNVLGDLIGGVGVLGSSVGLDGLSQFVSLTKTATTSAFYSRILQYRTELFGNGSGGPGSQIHLLKRKYRGLRVASL